MTTTNARTWKMFGHDLGEDAPGSRYVGVEANHRTAVMLNAGRTITGVTVTEDPDGEHLGWEATNTPGELTMVQHARIFNMQFASGYKAEERAGVGRAVTLTLTSTHI